MPVTIRIAGWVPTQLRRQLTIPYFSVHVLAPRHQVFMQGIVAEWESLCVYVTWWFKITTEAQRRTD